MNRSSVCSYCSERAIVYLDMVSACSRHAIREPFMLLVGTAFTRKKPKNEPPSVVAQLPLQPCELPTQGVSQIRRARSSA